MTAQTRELISSAVSQRVGAYVERSGTTKTHIAHDMGISRSTLRRKIHSGDFTLSEAYDLADIIGCNVSDFYREPSP